MTSKEKVFIEDTASCFFTNKKAPFVPPLFISPDTDGHSPAASMDKQSITLIPLALHQPDLAMAFSVAELNPA